MEKSKVTQTKKAHINRFAVIELIMVGEEDDDGRSWIVRKDQISQFIFQRRKERILMKCSYDMIKN